MSSEIKNDVAPEATVVTNTAPVAVTGKDQSGRVFEPFVLGFDGAVALFNKSATSENLVLAAAEKAAYVVGSVFLAIAEAFKTVFAGLYNMAIAPVNYFFGKEVEEKKETTASEPAQPTQSTPVEKKVEENNDEDKQVVVFIPKETSTEPTPAEQGRIQQAKEFAKRGYRTVVHYGSQAVAAAKSTTLATVAAAKAHPYRTAAIVGGVVLGGAGLYFAAPYIATLNGAINSGLGYIPAGLEAANTWMVSNPAEAILGVCLTTPAVGLAIDVANRK